MPDRSERLAALAALAAAFLVGAGLRAFGLNMSLFGDEVTTYQRALAPVGYHIAHVDSPLLSLLAHFSLRISDTEMGLRLPSFLAGCLAILAMYPLGTAVGGRVTGVFGAWILALAPFHLEHSQHARYYALLMLAGILWAWLLERALTRRERIAWVAFAVTTAWALLVHQFGWPYAAALVLTAAAWIVLLDRKTPWPTRRRQLAWLAGSVVMGSLALLIVYSAREESPLRIATALDASPVEGVAAADAPGHRLTPGGYAGFVDDLFRPLGKPYVYGSVLLALAVIGIASMLRQGRFTAYAVLAALLLPPLPLFFIAARHPYEVRYFSILLPLGLLAVACGMTALIRFAGGRAGRHRMAAQACTALAVAALLVPSNLGALNQYYGAFPPKDWKALHRHLAPTLEPGAIIFSLDPTGEMSWRLRTTRREYYLKRMMPDGPMLHGSLKELTGDLPAARLQALAGAHPESSIWVVALQGHTGPAATLLDTHADTVHHFGDVMLWQFGAPTTNLFEQAGFEAALPNPNPEASVGVVEAPDAYAGERYLRIHSSEMENTNALLRLVHGQPTVPLTIRNPSFAAWRGEAPVGWHTGEGMDSLAQGRGDRPGSSALRIRPGAAPVVVSQAATSGFAPGRTVRLRARGLANAGDTLRLSIRFEREGQIERLSTVHTGSGAWESMQLDAPLPEELDPESVFVEIFRGPDAAAACAVTDVSTEILSVSESLDPAFPYALSLMLRHEGLRSMYEDGNTQHAAAIRLQYLRADGEMAWQELHKVHGNRDWHALHFAIVPGVTVPFGARELTLQVHLYGTGEIGVDNVQLEARSSPSPFTPGRRLPHDEALAPALNGVTSTP